MNILTSLALLIKNKLDGKMPIVMTSAGDVIYGGVEGVPLRLPIGASNQVLTVQSTGDLGWQDVVGSGDATQPVMEAARLIQTQSIMAQTVLQGQL
jgi:hypothetical protein